MRISFIGSGNVATHLALAFSQHKHTIGQVWSRSMAHADLLASRVGAKATTKVYELRNSADLYIVAVTDSALQEIVPMFNFGNALVLHTSGITPIEVLKNSASRYGVVWSPYSFNRDIAIDYSSLPFCVECCDQQTTQEAIGIFSEISPKVFPATLQGRQILHLASVFVDNFPTAMYAIAQQLCRENDLPFDLLHSLLQGAADKVQWGDVRHLMTGPAVRDDLCTLDRHRQLLDRYPLYLDIYNELTHLIQTIRPRNPLPNND